MSAEAGRFVELSMPSDYKNVAVECNNVGVRLHQRDRHDLAVQAFCDAVHVMKNTPYPDERGDATNAQILANELELILASNYRRLEEGSQFGKPTVLTTNASIGRHRKGRVAASQSSYDATATPNSELESAIMIYSEPIMIDSRDSCQDAEMTGTIIFNLAMSHHLHAMKDGDRASIEKAMALYEMAHVAASSILKTDTSLGTRSRVLSVIMGSLNNLGQIHYVLHQPQATLVYFDEMSRVYSEHGCDGGPPGSWSGFWTNLFLFDFPQSAPAA